MSLLSVLNLSCEEIEEILSYSEEYGLGRDEEKILSNRHVVLIFSEASTRTLASFEMAISSLGGVPSCFELQSSSMRKGESIKDTLKTLDSYNPFCMILRHSESGFCNLASSYTKNPLINAGDGHNEHPTQALIDLSMIKWRHGRIRDLEIAMCGDIAHSRVAHSNIRLLKMFNNKINVISPPTMCLSRLEGVNFCNSLEEAIEGSDVIMCIRPQYERMHSKARISAAEYSSWTQLDVRHLKHASTDVLVLHPGPLTNQTEMTNELSEFNQDVTSQQTKKGVEVRKAVLKHIKIRSEESPAKMNRCDPGGI